MEGGNALAGCLAVLQYHFLHPLCSLRLRSGHDAVVRLHVNLGCLCAHWVNETRCGEAVVQQLAL